jgi:hypothetical protein
MIYKVVLLLLKLDFTLYLTPTPLLKVEGLSVPIAVIIEPGAHPICSKMIPKKQSAIHGLMDSYCLEVILVTSSEARSLLIFNHFLFARCPASPEAGLP